MIIYFLGGGDIRKGITKQIEQSIVNKIKTPFLLVIPWTTGNADKLENYNKIIVDYFTSLGVKTITFLDYSDSNNVITKKVASSNIIYLPGGDPEILFKKLKEKKLKPLLESYKGCIIGNSAGAMVIGKSALNIVDFNIEPYYSPEKDAQLLDSSKDSKIYAIKEDSALILENGNMYSAGEVYLFFKNKKRRS